MNQDISIKHEIFKRLHEFQSKTAENPTRIILGRETYDSLLNERDLFVYEGLGVLSRYGQVMGLRITVSKRRNYIRILPAKLKYWRRKPKTWKQEHYGLWTYGRLAKHMEG